MGLLHNMTKLDRDLDHDVEVCGLCCHQKIMADTARDLLAKGADPDGREAIEMWEAEVKARWEKSKFYITWQQALSEGKDPRAVFVEKGWEL